MKRLYAYLLPMLFVPALSIAECNHFVAVPYQQLEPDSTQVRLAIVPIANELGHMGLLKWIEHEIGGNRAIVCLIMRPGQSRWGGDFGDTMMSLAGATLLSNFGQIRDMYNAPRYRRMIDPETGMVVFQDGRDGRPARTIGSDASRFDRLRERGIAWRERNARNIR